MSVVVQQNDDIVLLFLVNKIDFESEQKLNYGPKSNLLFTITRSFNFGIVSDISHTLI